MEPYLCAELIPVISETPPQTPGDLQTMRSEGDRLFAGVKNSFPGVNLEVNTIPGGDGQPLELRCFTPSNAAEPSAIMLAIHGGGYVAGRASFDDARNAELADFLGSVVMSPDYRLAPEYPADRAIADCRAALLYALSRGRELGLDVFVFGDSAGGGLAFYSLASLERQSVDTAVAGMILFEPCLDPRCDTDSMRAHANAPVWTPRANQEAWALAAPTTDLRQRLVEVLDSAAVARAMPPSLIVVNPIDPLRDEGLRLALHLADSGVPVEAHMYPGTFHGSLSAAGTKTWAEIRQLMRRFMSSPGTSSRD